MKIGMISFANHNAWEYARCIKEMGFELLGITDEEKERGKEASKAFATTYFESKEELLSQPIDVVIVCSETAKHKGDVLLSAQAKKHIICEMPLAVSLADAQEMARICEENGVFLIPSVPLRYSPPLRRAKELIDEGQMGEIMAMKGTHRTKLPEGWKVVKGLAGGGALLQNAIYLLDVMRWLVGDEVIEIYVELARSPHLDIEVEDVATAALKFKKGIFATLDSSWCYPPAFPFWGDFTIDIVGREGTLIVDAFAQVLSYADGKESPYAWKYWGSDMHSLMLKDYLQCLSEGKKPAVQALDGLKALEVALKGYESGERKEPVSL